MFRSLSLCAAICLFVSIAAAQEAQLKVVNETDVTYGKAGDIELKLDVAQARR
ncbi:MAG: hypothetical protein QM811_25295 [Pirellulales bacterium]